MSSTSSSPLNRLSTNHISFEELDEFVKIETVSRWGRNLSVSFPDIVLTPEMVQTLCQAIKQSVHQSVGHDCTLDVSIDCVNANLGDDLLSAILAEAMPLVMRKAGRVSLSKFNVAGNPLTQRTVDELKQVIQLHREAKYRYKVPVSVSVDLESILATSLQEMSQAILSGLKSKSVLPADVTTSISKPLLSSAMSDKTDVTSISKSLLSMLQKNKPPSVLKNSDKMMSLAELEARIVTPPKSPVTTLRVNLHVFSLGATHLCGLELQLEPDGYRVVRVTEKPGQGGRVKEGDLITHVAGHALEPSSMRQVFGTSLADGVQVTIKRGEYEKVKDENKTVVRELDYELTTAGAGVTVTGAAAAQQAQLVCQTFGLEGGIEQKKFRIQGPLAKVDQAMRQFCVLLVKAGVRK